MKEQDESARLFTPAMVELLKENMKKEFSNVQARYNIYRKLGQGTYGVVAAARERVSGRKVAVKKINFDDEDEEQAKLMLRELKLLRHFRGHENIICIRDVIACENDGIYIVTELMDTSLDHIISSSQKLSDEHLKYFTYQILRGLKYLHSANVMHRDLKPNNLLVNANCDLRICDLGLARLTAEAEPCMTVYVVARWYRAPELLLGKKNYDLSIDMWAVGCILAEMLTRRPLFCGRDYMDMLRLQIATIGSPAPEETVHLGSRARRWVHEVPNTQRPALTSLFPKSNQQLVALLDQLLQFTPNKRITAPQALKHKSMADFHDPDDEPDCAQEFDFENTGGESSQMTGSLDFKKLIHEEITQHYTRGHHHGGSRRKRTAPSAEESMPVGPTSQEVAVWCEGEGDSMR